MTREGIHYTGTVRLECGNELSFEVAPPCKGTEVWCRKHSTMHKVAKRYQGSTYKVKCKTCKYARGYGQGRLTAECAAASHHQRKPDHVVQLWKGQKLLHTFGQEGQGSLLDLEPTTEPAF